MAEDLFAAAMVAGSLSVEAALGSRVPFDARLHAVRGHAGQIAAAAAYRHLLGEASEIGRSHQPCEQVQDPYSLRCQPQVMGACLAQIRHAADDAAHRSRTPFPTTRWSSPSRRHLFRRQFPRRAGGLRRRQSGPGDCRDRRTRRTADRAADRHASLEAAAVLGGEGRAELGLHDRPGDRRRAGQRKQDAGPSRPRSIRMPTSANQEDHVSMATFAARRLGDMGGNTAGIRGRRAVGGVPRGRFPQAAADLAAAWKRPKRCCAARCRFTTRTAISRPISKPRNG